MSIQILIANILTFLAFLVHAFWGDKDLRMIRPVTDSSNWITKQEKWTMARCGWHWISFDLLFASIGLALINFTDFLSAEILLLQILAIYFLGYAIVWFVTIAISQKFEKNFIKLGQWILLLVISGLIFWKIC